MYRVLCSVLLAIGVLSACNQTPTPTNLDRNPILRPLAVGTSYHVDSSGGNDANDGTSASTAWQTLAKVNGFTFQPGDELLFKAGGVWSGQLYPKGSGNSANVIAIDQYGTGNKPRFDGNGAVTDTLLLYNQQYWDIRGLELTNDTAARAERTAVHVVNNTAGVLNHVYISDLYIHDVKGTVNQYYGKNAGISVESYSNSSLTSWNDIKINNNVLETIDRIGIFVGPDGDAATTGRSTNVEVKTNKITNSGGDDILMYRVDGGLVESNIAFNGGGRTFTSPCPATGYCNQYPASMWTAASNNITFQFNEVGFNQGLGDGQAFDFDFAVTNSKVQYNYSHDNPGGLILFVGDGVHTGNVVRYNISQNDGTTSGHGAFNFSLFVPQGTLEIYNNTVYIPSVSSSNVVSIYSGANQSSTGISLENNIFYNLGNGGYVTPPGVVYDSNQYFGNHPASEPADARKSTGDPLLVSAGSGGNGLGSLSGYALQTASPVGSTGLNIANNGGRDFFAQAVSGGVSRGAAQGGSSASALIANGDFENGTASWIPAGGSLVNSGAQSGSNAFQIDAAFSGVFQTISGLTPNTDYTLTGWAKVGTAGEPVYIGVKNYGGTETNGDVTSTNYTQVAFSFKTGSSNTSAEIYCWRNDGTTPAVCDNFKVVGGASTNPNLVNLAIGGTVTASSSIENYGFLLSMLLDGNRNSGWSSDGNLTANHTEWLELDLGAVKTFNRIDLYPRNDSGMVGEGFPVDFTIDVWNGSGWNNAITRSGYAKPSNAVQTFTFASENTNRIRIQGTNLRPISADSNKYRMQLNEIEVFLQ